MRLRLAVLAVAACSLGACAAPDTGVTATRSGPLDDTPLLPADTTATSPGDSTAPQPTTTTAPLPVEEGVIDFGSGKKPRAYDGYLIAVFKDVERYWNEQFPAVYGEKFQPLQQGVYAAYPGRNEPIPGCGSPRTTYDEVEGNAFYCSAGDFMVYDDADLIPQLVDELGESAVGIVLAHEFGHAVQARAGNFAEPTILKEQQADCFAGAWAAHVARGESEQISFGDNDIKGGLIAMIQVRDPVQISGTFDPGAHGTGFDRVGAFQDGFIGGAERCKSFFTEGRENNLIQIPFVEDDPNKGNLPFDEILTATADHRSLVDELVRYWTELFANSQTAFNPPTVVTYPGDGPYPDCPGIDDSQYKKNVVYCAATNEVLLDETYGRELAGDEVTGDMSVGYLISDGFSEAVLTTIGSHLEGVDRKLSDDCLTGSWVRDMVPPLPESRDTKSLELSAGDLDEAIITAIVFGDPSSDADINGTAFEKIDAFRRGVLQGRDGCPT